MKPKENWLSETLCSFEEKTRIELGPQLIELECNDDNLDDEVTSPHYRIGGRDAATGKIIRKKAAIKLLESRIGKGSAETRDKTAKALYGLVTDEFGSVEEGETMTCVDWRCKHKPKVWKVYQWQDTGKVIEDDKAPGLTQGDPIWHFAKIKEFELRDDALNFASALAGEM